MPSVPKFKILLMKKKHDQPFMENILHNTECFKATVTQFIIKKFGGGGEVPKLVKETYQLSDQVRFA